MKYQNNCPRCAQPNLKSWPELTVEEREVVKRLPASAENTLEERIASHSWCTRCWLEVTEPAANA